MLEKISVLLFNFALLNIVFIYKPSDAAWSIGLMFATALIGIFWAKSGINESIRNEKPEFSWPMEHYQPDGSAFLT